MWEMRGAFGLQAKQTVGNEIICNNKKFAKIRGTAQRSRVLRGRSGPVPR